MVHWLKFSFSLFACSCILLADIISYLIIFYSCLGKQALFRDLLVNANNIAHVFSVQCLSDHHRMFYTLCDSA